MIAQVLPSGRHGRCRVVTVEPEDLVNLLMLLPEDLRRAVARALWFDMEDADHGRYAGLRAIADMERLDDPISYTAEEYRDALIIVGVPVLKAQWRAVIKQQQIDRERAGTSPAEKVRIFKGDPVEDDEDRRRLRYKNPSR